MQLRTQRYIISGKRIESLKFVNCKFQQLNFLNMTMNFKTHLNKVFYLEERVEKLS